MNVIRLGVPEMERLWHRLTDAMRRGTASKDDVRLYYRLGKAMVLLAANPRHPGLQTHDIDALTRRYGMKVWQSYLENNTPSAGRIFWVYGPGRSEITIIGVEPHPEDKKNAGYNKVTLSDLPE